MRFASLEEMREHYTTDFHTANVRARVEGQAKMSAAEYRRRTMEDDEKKPVFHCKLCKKEFRSVQTLQSHVKSTEHLMRKEQRIIERDSTAGSMLTSTSLGSAALGLHRRHRAHLRARTKQQDPALVGRTLTEVEAEERGEKPAAAAPVEKKKVSFEDREADVTETRCLFCGHPSKTMRGNLQHMLQAHEFVIPMHERCTDVRGLLQYLARKVNGLMCLVCGTDTKTYESLEALRAHMAAANHERLTLSSEYDQFYQGHLDDGDAAEVKNATEDGNAALIVRNDKQRKVVKRDQRLLGMVRRLAENSQQADQRRMITAAGHAESQLMLKERRQETQKERTKHFKTINEQYRIRKRFQLAVGVKKLWKKGFDGEGMLN